MFQVLGKMGFFFKIWDCFTWWLNEDYVSLYKVVSQYKCLNLVQISHQKPKLTTWNIRSKVYVNLINSWKESVIINHRTNLVSYDFFCSFYPIVSFMERRKLWGLYFNWRVRLANTPTMIANTPNLIANTPIVITHTLVPKQWHEAATIVQGVALSEKK